MQEKNITLVIGIDRLAERFQSLMADAEIGLPVRHCFSSFARKREPSPFKRLGLPWAPAFAVANSA